MNSKAVIAIVLGGNLVLCLWVWYRARPGSGAVKALSGMALIWVRAMPVVALLTVAMLLSVLPKLFWPAAEGIHVAGTIASLIVSTSLSVVMVRRLVIEIRRQRSLRRAARLV